MNIAEKAARTAHTIAAVKVVLIGLNLVTAAVGVIAGASIWTTRTVSEFGVMQTGTNPVAVAIVVLSLITGIIGSLLVHVVLGWFEGMLATNAAILESVTRPAADVDLVTGQPFQQTGA